MIHGYCKHTPYSEVKAEVKALSNDDLANAILKVAYGDLSKRMGTRETLALEEGANRLRKMNEEVRS